MQGVCLHQTRPSDKWVGLIKSIRLDQDASRSCIALSLHRNILICVYIYPKSAGRSEGDLMAIGDYSYDDKGAVFLTRREPMGDYLSYVERYALSSKQIGVRQRCILPLHASVDSLG
jgi:hypothetical protein